MEEQRPNTERKRDGFRGERMIVLPTEAFSDYVRHPLVRRLYLTDVGFFPSAAHHYRERREGIEEYIFLYCMDGSGQITVEDRTYTLRGEEAFCIPRNRSHCYYASEEDPWSILWVHFKGEDTVHFPLEEGRYMYRHLDENLSLGALSEEFELSKSYLNLIFQKATGHTPMDFFQELKMKEACKLLRSTELYIYQIGQRLGYQDPYYFSRIFRKVVGVSPTEYQEKGREQQDM